MRIWLLAVSALTLVALTSPIAGEKRSSALAVRVSVVRSCSVNTDSALQAGGTVSCGTRFGVPVVSSSSTITLPVPNAPSALVEQASASAPNQPRDARDVQAVRPADAGAERITETVTQIPDGTPGQQNESVAIRVMTVNF